MFMVLGIEVDIFTKFYIQCPAWLGRQCTVRLSRNMPALPDRWLSSKPAGAEHSPLRPAPASIRPPTPTGAP